MGKMEERREKGAKIKGWLQSEYERLCRVKRRSEMRVKHSLEAQPGG
jgi:hypothetical protein